MRMNEKLTNRVYDREVGLYMPPIAQVIVMENQADERRHLAAIEAHIERHVGGGLVTQYIPRDQERSQPASPRY
jgi:hypothetical protein